MSWHADYLGPFASFKGYPDEFWVMRSPTQIIDGWFVVRYQDRPWGHGLEPSRSHGPFPDKETAIARARQMAREDRTEALLRGP